MGASETRSVTTLLLTTGTHGYISIGGCDGFQKENCLPDFDEYLWCLFRGSTERVCFSTKAIYFDKELTVAERAASRFHELHNQQNFTAIYDVLDKQVHPGSPENILSQIKASYDKLGRSVESRLVEKKVLPSPGAAIPRR